MGTSHGMNSFHGLGPRTLLDSRLPSSNRRALDYETPTVMDPIYLPPATKLRQGNVFTPVCQLFCSPGGVLVSVQGGLCTKGLCWGVCLRVSVHGVSVWGVSVRGDLCHRDPLYGNVRATRILMECILVAQYFH